ncbi:MAG TPA: hypothetical protein VHO50_06585 [Bacteroidales bacterium]|nr:hypothetical protein [Bacteroidales bacterium]
MRKTKFITILFIILSLIMAESCSVFSRRAAANKVERKMSVKSRGFRESRAVRGEKARQEKNQDRLKNDYAKSVKASRKRTYEIQTEDVKARMKKNEIDLAKREKEKSKNKRASMKKGRKKYS